MKKSALRPDKKLLENLQAAYFGFRDEIRRYPGRGTLEHYWTSGWMYLSSGLILLEQAFKVLIHVHDREFDREVMKSKKCGHSFKKINCHMLVRLPEKVMDRLQRGYNAYCSLHGGHKSLEDFLHRVDGEYEMWRYGLIEKEAKKKLRSSILSVEVISELLRLTLLEIELKVEKTDKEMLTPSDMLLSNLLEGIRFPTVGDRLESVLSHLWNNVNIGEMEEWERKAWLQLGRRLFTKGDHEEYLNGYLSGVQAEKGGEDSLLEWLGPSDKKTENFFMNIWRNFRENIVNKARAGNGGGIDWDLMRLADFMTGLKINLYWDGENKIFKRPLSEPK